jgi:hypothetical protein
MDPLGGSNYQRNAACGGNSADQGVERHWRERTIKGSLKKNRSQQPLSFPICTDIGSSAAIPYLLPFSLEERIMPIGTVPLGTTPYEVGAHEGGCPPGMKGIPLWGLPLVGTTALYRSLRPNPG